MARLCVLERTRSCVGSYGEFFAIMPGHANPIMRFGLFPRMC